MVSIKEDVERIVQELHRLASAEDKPTAFCIGNTRKINTTGLYFSPIRKTSRLVAGSVIVYNVAQAIAVSRAVDGKVDYVLVDAEKKIGEEMYGCGDVGNIERSVRECVSKSKVLTFKGNDLTVDSVESLIVNTVSKNLRGLGGLKAGILGAGNVGSKLALKLVERGMDVSLFRRDRSKLTCIVDALNVIKPAGTKARVKAAQNCFEVSHRANVLIGLTPGTQAITREMIDGMEADGILIDAGKGCCDYSAINRAQELNIPIFRADIRAGFEGYVSRLFESEQIIKKLGRAMFWGVPVVAGGLLGRKSEVVVDSIEEPSTIYGVADGFGDFVREYNSDQLGRLKIIQDYIKRTTL